MKSPFNVYEQLGSIRMTACERREAIVHMRRAEAIADLILRGAGLLRRAVAGVAAAVLSKNMRSFLVLIGVLGFVFSAPLAARASSDQGPAIQVLEGDWGNADTGEIETLLHSVASELWRFFPERSPSKLVVIASEKGPLALYQRGPNGEYVILLSAKNKRWAQYAYQFSHELCHVLSNHDHHAKPNQWFEEAMWRIVFPIGDGRV
jgi:hypothetical protein